MKKLILSALLTASLIGGASFAAGCNAQEANRSVADGVKTADQFYSYAAASVGSIISSQSAFEISDGNLLTADGYATVCREIVPVSDSVGSGATLSDEQIATINSYMELVENLLGDGKASNVQTESDRPEYEIREDVSFSDLEGNLFTYTMYYNRTVIGNEYEQERRDKEEETEYSISGIMLIDDVEYPMEGRHETEISNGEEEVESFFKVTLNDDAYIVMEQEIEEDEQSFVYEIRSNGSVRESVKFSYENEYGETELKMSVLKDGEKSVLRFKEEIENGEREIAVKAEIGGQSVNFKICVTYDAEGNEIYRYKFAEKVKDMVKPEKQKDKTEKYETEADGAA